jgi:hypothetical protein
MVARANQRAAAFIRFQMMGDREACIVPPTSETDTADWRVTALASIARDRHRRGRERA